MQGNKRNNKLKNGRLIFVIILCIGVIGGIGFVVAKPDAYAQYRDVSEEKKLTGTLKSMDEEISDTSLKFLHYPQFDHDTINKQIEEYTNSLADVEGISFLDYESKEIDSRYISIAFTLKQLSMDESLIATTHTYMNFDKVTGKKLQLDDVFRRDYEAVIKEQALSQLQLTLDSLDNVAFELQDKGIRLRFENEKELTLAYSDHTALMRLEGDNLPTIAKQRLQRKRTTKIDPNKPMIAFSFDDGPSLHTEDVMKIFEDNNANATFFMLGKNVEQYPDVVKNMYEKGFEIANHSWDHTALNTDDTQLIKDQIYNTQDALFKICGDDPKLLRPPYGQINNNLIHTSSLYLTLWNIDTRDWDTRNTESIVSSSRSEFRDGSVILFHDLYPTTVEAVRILVPELIAQGYQLVTTSELLEHRKVESGI